MSTTLDRAGRRLLERQLKRVGVDPSSPPDSRGWAEFLDAIEALLSDLEQDRYLLERSLDTSSDEMHALNQELQTAAELLAVEREELRQSNSVLMATLESTADGILVEDGRGAVTAFNRRFCDLWGLPEEVMAPGSSERILAWVVDRVRDPDGYRTQVIGAHRDRGAVFHETVELRDGRLFEYHTLPQEIDGEFGGRVWSFRDVTDQRRLEHQLVHQAFHDPLTGLSNRAMLGERIDHALKRSAREGTPVAVVIIDLDGFKLVNDSLGHVAGDTLLVALAERFRRNFRDVDTIARMGGDEFAMVIEGLDTPDQVAAIGQRILDVVGEPFAFEDRTFIISASVGIALSGEDAHSPDMLLGNADAAMYWGKRESKNCFRVFESSMHTTTVERLDIEQALREAVKDDALSIHYQPVVDTRTGRVVSFEALARWTSPDRGVVPPDVFIPVAEETGLIFDIGRWVLREACRQTRCWQDEFPDVHPTIAVNVSRLQLIDPGFADDVSTALEAAELDPASLTLEITETILSSDTSAIGSTLERLRATGVRVAIDDFGTGYSSLGVLADLPVDALKIDKRFIDAVTVDHRGKAFVEAITRLGQTLGLVTVAEGVEFADQHTLLRGLGCDYLQGYLFGRPLDVADTRTLLERVGG